MDKQYAIFLADDDEEDRFLFETALKEANVDSDLFFAPDGIALLDMVMNFPKVPTIIMLDVNMPRQDGLACLDGIRAIKKFDQTPVVMFSSTADDEAIERAYNSGADFYIQKPSTFPDLIAVIRFCLEIGLSKNNERSKEDFLIIYPKKRKTKI